jgi:hypothetical protein
MPRITAVAAAGFTAAMLATGITAPTAVAAPVAAARTAPSITATAGQLTPVRNPERCNHRFYRLRHELYCHHHRTYH